MNIENLTITFTGGMTRRDDNTEAIPRRPNKYLSESSKGKDAKSMRQKEKRGESSSKIGKSTKKRNHSIFRFCWCFRLTP